jgi:hypothetical protein
MTEVRKANAGHEANIAGSDNRNLHNSHLKHIIPWAKAMLESMVNVNGKTTRANAGTQSVHEEAAEISTPRTTWPRCFAPRQFVGKFVRLTITIGCEDCRDKATDIADGQLS